VKQADDSLAAKTFMRREKSGHLACNVKFPPMASQVLANIVVLFAKILYAKMFVEEWKSPISWS